MRHVGSFYILFLVTVLALVAGIISFTVRLPVAIAQTTPSFFTIVFVPDIHWDYLDGSPNPYDRVYWDRARASVRVYPH
jgi:hypothetical protein